MDERSLPATLAAITGFLEPTADATAADLRTARLALASALLRGQTEDTHVTSSHSTTPEPISNAELMAELESVRAEAVLEAETKRGEPLDTRLFRREFPVLTSANPASVPAWAAGLRPDLTLGPFITFGGWPVWFDLYRPVHQARVLQAPGGAMLLGLPIRGQLRAATTYRLARGSAWIFSRLLSGFAPAGSWTGLRILGGTLKLSAPPTIVAGTIQLAVNTTITLTLRPDPTAPAPGTGLGPGADGANSLADVPAEATFVLQPGSPAVATAGDASLTMYGVTAPLHRTADSPSYDDTLNRILIPYTTPLAAFTVVQSRSDLFTLSGTAPIGGAAWALPVAVTNSGALGTAAGAGALVLETLPGLKATWRGQAGGSVSLGAAFLAMEQGLLSVTATQARNRRATQTLKLWLEDTGTRHSSIDLQYTLPFPLQFFSLQSGIETLTVEGTAACHLDRPRCADGMRLGLLFPSGVLELFESTTDRGAFFLGSFPTVIVIGPPAPDKPLAFALRNALLKTTSAITLTLFGRLDDAVPLAITTGSVNLRFGLYLILPALPDPYAANFNVPLERSGNPFAELNCRVAWSTPETPVLSFAFLPLQAATAIPTEQAGASLGVNPLKTRTAADVRLGAQSLAQAKRGTEQDPGQIFEEDGRRTRALRHLFNEVVQGTNETVFLLDVSSNADQFGVCLGFRERSPGSFPLQVQDLDLAAGGYDVRLFTLPQVQWEPLYTIQNPDVGFFPSPLRAEDDGGATRIGVDTVELVPIAPRPVLDQIVTLFNTDGDNRRAGALFTLPFGMKALALLLLPDDRDTPGAFLNLNQPRFATLPQPLAGGLQLKVSAYSPDDGPGLESPTLLGAAIQLRNGIGIDEFGNAVFRSVLGDITDHIFNGEFAPAPDGANPRVPVTRLDLSGYGASIFSRWVNPRATIDETSQVRFDVMVGRTAYEVVQVRSILYPWGVTVIRTVTIQRTGGGGVYRRDSGWIAASDGVYDFPVPVKGSAFQIVTHPGVVKGLFDVRNIRDTSQIYEQDYTEGGATVKVRLAAVRFDANVRISGVLRGASNGDVPSVNQIGFVQLEPSGQPLTPEQFADLLHAEGPLGGPVDCLIEVDASGQQMRLTRVDADSALTPGGQLEFAVAGRGSPILPGDGQWSVVLRPADDTLEPQALDHDFGIPLVREGVAGLDDAINANPYQFAEAANVLQPELAPADYGWLWSTGTQRVLFARPKIAKGAKAISSSLSPLLADSYAMGGAVGIFPSAVSCLDVPAASYTLQILANGGLRLVLPVPRFPASLVGGGKTRELGNSATTRFYVDYTNTQISLALDSVSAPSWTYKQEGLAIVHEDSGARVKTTHGKICASSVSAPRFTLQAEEFGEVLSPVKQVLPLFGSLSLGGSIPNDGATAPLDSTPARDSFIKTKAGLKISQPIPPGLPVFVGTTTDGDIELETDFHTFFSLDIVVTLAVALVFPGAGKFTYEVEGINAAKPLPGTSHTPQIDSKQSLLLAIGVYGDGEDDTLAPIQFDYKVFAGFAFTYESKPGEKSVGIGGVYDVQASLQYPVEVALVEAGIKVQGQILLELRTGGHVFGVLKGRVAFELIVALILDIEFDLPDFTIAEIKLGK
jgi:hypothetical protein